MTLTKAEYDQLYNTALCAFAERSHQEMVAEIYALRKPCTECHAQLLWLYVYALRTWDNTDGAINYITEKQMLRILSKVQNHGL